MMQSRVVSFRLHPSDEYEAKAIEVLDYWLNEGVNIRHLLTDALLRLDGQTPEMFNSDEQALTRGTLSAILDRKMAELRRDLADELSTLQVVAQSDEAPSTAVNETESGLSPAEQNLLKGFKKRRSR